MGPGLGLGVQVGELGLEIMAARRCFWSSRGAGLGLGPGWSLGLRTLRVALLAGLRLVVRGVFFPRLCAMGFRFFLAMSLVVGCSLLFGRRPDGRNTLTQESNPALGRLGSAATLSLANAAPVCAGCCVASYASRHSMLEDRPRARGRGRAEKVESLDTDMGFSSSWLLFVLGGKAQRVGWLRSAAICFCTSFRIRCLAR